MFARILMIAALLCVGVAWSPGAFPADDVPAAKKKPAGAPAESKDSAAARKALKQYHGSAVQAFIETPGFGHDRMPPMLRVIVDIRVEWTSQDVEEDKSRITVPDLAKAHRDRIAGYQRDPWLNLKLPGNRVSSLEAGDVKHTWRLHRIDLIAIVDHDEPIVYITPAPIAALAPGPGAFRTLQEAEAARLRASLDAVADSKGKAKAEPTRPPNSRAPNHLELAALDRFRDGEDVLVRSKGNVLQMVGALRATKQCLECHTTAKQGDLFGAFSYTLARTPR